MKILVDADACPVKKLIVAIAKEYAISVIMFIDTSHVLDDGFSTIITVDKGRDSVDMSLINKLEKGDIVVSQDYGVASMALARNCYAINQNGLIYTNDNIDSLLYQRYVSQKIRKGGGKTTNPKKRTNENDEAFLTQFRYLCQKALSQK